MAMIGGLAVLVAPSARAGGSLCQVHGKGCVDEVMS